MRIVIAGPKGAGKSTVGTQLSAKLGLEPFETDQIIEDLFQQCQGRKLSCREIFREFGEEYFRSLEEDAVQMVASNNNCVIITGGSTLMNEESREVLGDGSLILLLTGDPEILWKRATARGTPPWLEGQNGKQIYTDDLKMREETIRPFAKVILDSSGSEPEQLAELAYQEISKLKGSAV